MYSDREATNYFPGYERTMTYWIPRPWVLFCICRAVRQSGLMAGSMIARSRAKLINQKTSPTPPSMAPARAMPRPLSRFTELSIRLIATTPQDQGQNPEQTITPPMAMPEVRSGIFLGASPV